MGHRLRPGVLEDLCLISAALTALANEPFVHIGQTVPRRFDAELPPLPGDVQLELYRVAQESLTNIERHADATHIELALSSSVHRDSFARRRRRARARSISEGAGIHGMRERALLVGADLVILSWPDVGVVVTLAVPVGGSGD